jgi:mono/diheme cytochrome c family protein
MCLPLLIDAATIPAMGVRNVSFVAADRKGTLRAAGAVFVLTILLTASPYQARAQNIGDIVAGRRLSETWCSSCHLVGPGSAGGVSNGAPPFEAIARQKSTTALSLRVFLQTPHGRMPDLHFSQGEIDDIAAYILSLRTRGGQ